MSTSIGTWRYIAELVSITTLSGEYISKGKYVCAKYRPKTTPTLPSNTTSVDIATG